MTSAKKILALTITMLMMLSSVGTFALAAETVTLDAVYLIQGQSYTLPTTIGEYTDIVWDSAVSTDNVGVQTITGTSGETPLSITVYVGELTNHKVTENFESFSEDDTATKVDGYTTISSSSSTLVFYMNSDSVKDDFSVVTIDGDKAVKFGAAYANWTSRIQQIQNVAKNAPHRFTFKYRMDLDAANVINDKTVGSLRVHDSTSTGSVFAHLYIKTNSDSTAISIQPERPSDSTYDRPVAKIADIDSATNSTGWINFEFIFYADNTYDLYVDNTKVISGMGTYLTTVEKSSPAGLTVQNASNVNATNTHYIDDIVIYGGNYVTGELPASLEGAAYTGTDGTGEAAVSLAMTSGTKDFAVKYTVPADDLTEGNTVTVQGSIDGFTQTVPVEVTVKASDSKNTTIKTSQNCPVTLPQTYNDLSITWDKAVDVSKVGTITYNGITAKETGITCTVIVGDYTVQEENVIADMSADDIGVENSSQTQKEYNPTGTNAWYVIMSEDYSDILVTDYNDEKVLKIGPARTSYSSFIGVQNASAFSDGTYKISADMKIADATIPTGSSSNIFNLRIRNVTEAANVLVYLNTDGTLSFRGYGEKAAQQDKEKNTDIKVTDGETPWFNVTFLFYEDLTYDLFVNDQQITSRLPFYYEDTTKYTSLKFGRFIVADQKDGISTQYVKNLEMSTYRYFDGTLPTEFDFTLGHNVAVNEKTTLTMSDATEREFSVLTGDVDGTKVGQFNVTGAIEGFDTPVAISARVCDYLIKEVRETSAGIDKATIQKIGAATSGVAVFAYYGSDHKIAKVKSVPFTDSDFTNGVAELTVGLEYPTDAEGGYVKGFIFNSLSGIMPLDVVFTPAQ